MSTAHRVIAFPAPHDTRAINVLPEDNKTLPKKEAQKLAQSLLNDPKRPYVRAEVVEVVIVNTNAPALA